MLHTMVVLLTCLHCNAMPACAARLKPKTPAPCMQPTANTQQCAYTCLLHGHAKHAMNSHAMPSSTHATTTCRVCLHASDFLVHIPYQLGLAELAQQRSKAPRGSVLAEPPPGAVAEQATGPPRHHAPTPTCINAGMGHMKHFQHTGLPVTVLHNRTGYYIHRRLQDHNRSTYIQVRR